MSEKDIRPHQTLEIVYHWDDGTEQVIHRKDAATFTAVQMQKQVIRLQQSSIFIGQQCPYTWRIV